jgi:hypothetical protein
MVGARRRTGGGRPAFFVSEKRSARQRLRPVSGLKACGQRVELDPAEMAEWDGAEITVPE